VGTRKFKVTEINDGGHVPELTVLNGLDADVLILDGEELVGAKQNRIVNTTLIIGRMREVVIPVSCVEQGRWHYRTKAFKSSKANLYAELRKKKAKAVSMSLN
jgi:ARG and Rhodanese-Phosphatase-superfamily-associated Protein domain